MRGFLWSAVIDGLGPLLIYYLARRHTTEFAAIGWSTLPPAVNSVQSLIRKRRVDIIGLIVLLGLGAGLGLLLLGGSPRLLLVRDSLITGVIGLVFLASLFFPRPLLFYVLRQITAGGDAAEAEAWDAEYAESRFKLGLPLITGVWGAALVGEALLRTALALRLPTGLFLTVSPFINFGMYGAVSAWSLLFGRRVREREEALWENEAAKTARQEAAE